MTKNKGKIVGYIIVNDEGKPLCVGNGYGNEGEVLPKSGEMLWLGDWVTVFQDRRKANKALNDGRWYDTKNHSEKLSWDWNSNLWKVKPVRGQ